MSGPHIRDIKYLNIAKANVAQSIMDARWVAKTNGTVGTVKQFYSTFDYRNNGKLRTTAVPYSVKVCECCTYEIACKLVDEHNERVDEAAL
jgi:hypothetical protein